MLSRKNRLKKNKEFSYVYKKGKVLSDKYFTIHYVFTNLADSKIGISINKKVGNSVIRHKFKRYLAEAVRPLITNMKLKNYVITAKPEITTLSVMELQAHLLDCLTKGNLYVDNQ